MFSYKKFAIMCTKKGTYPTTIAIAIGKSNAAATGWKNGKMPRDDTVQALAAALGCSVDDLMEDEENPATQTDSGVDPIELEIRKLFDDCTEAEKKALLESMKSFKAVIRNISPSR